MSQPFRLTEAIAAFLSEDKILAVRIIGCNSPIINRESVEKYGLPAISALLLSQDAEIGWPCDICMGAGIVHDDPFNPCPPGYPCPTECEYGMKWVREY